MSHEYEAAIPSTAEFGQWEGVMDFLVRKEVREEVGLEIGDPILIGDVAFRREYDDHRVVVFPYTAPWRKGEVRLNHELSEFAWVTAREAEAYDLIPGIINEIRKAEKVVKN